MTGQKGVDGREKTHNKDNKGNDISTNEELSVSLLLIVNLKSLSNRELEARD